EIGAGAGDPEEAAMSLREVEELGGRFGIDVVEAPVGEQYLAAVRTGEQEADTFAHRATALATARMGDFTGRFAALAHVQSPVAEVRPEDPRAVARDRGAVV